MSTCLVRAIRGENNSRPPFWFMRQAGRYLPEYRELRAKAGSFLNLCYTPELAAEVTLQPLRRFDMDAAIIFSDILVVPHAMGLHLEYREGEGPVLSPVTQKAQLENLKSDMRTPLAPVAEAIARVRLQLSQGKSLIGFCGAPWTVACYMVEGKNNGGWQEAKRIAAGREDFFAGLIECLVTASAEYLCLQIEAGADVIQIFDSWAGVLEEDQFRKWVIEPTQKLVKRIRDVYPDIAVIGFPKGAGRHGIRYAQETGINVLGIGGDTDIAWAKANVEKPLQGNLDPQLLASDRHRAVEATKRILEVMRDRPFIFNLGHGIVPHTPIDHVMAVSDTIRAATI